MYIKPPERDGARLLRRRGPRRWRDRPLVWLSILLHGALLLGFWLVRPPPPPPETAPSDSFDIVLDGGARTATSNGRSQPNAAPALTEGVSSPAPSDATTSEPSPAPPPIAPQVASIPAPEAVPQPAPEPTQEPAPQPVEQPPAPVVPPQPSPPRVELNLQEMPMVRPVPIPQPLPMPTPPPPLPPPPRPRQFARPQQQRSPSGFPMPQNWSLAGAGSSRPTTLGGLGHADITGPSQPAPMITGANLGRDWIAAYRAWVQARLYYPEQARELGQDGASEVILKINRFGKVLSVELISRSGSQWLDLETTGLFRGRSVPAFPPDTKEDEATIDQTIQYILRR